MNEPEIRNPKSEIRANSTGPGFDVAVEIWR
jgi:hypothetical protein